MFVFALSATLTEKPWLSLSFKSISTAKQEPFIEDCYRRFFYMSACEQEMPRSNLGNGAGTSRNLFLKHSSEKEKGSFITLTPQKAVEPAESRLTRPL
jgi:hypothetical protein